MIGYVYVECMLYDVHSLKEKRSIIKQVIHQTRNRFNVSITEMDYQDLWQRCAFGIATVSSRQVINEKTLQEVVRWIDQRTDLEVTVIEYEWL
ncbi:DUF503 domain-containing protein [Tenuibacillus multivorans]|uniref:YlxP-like protein n=1 Tax=Tenuibacillus multivorans TaxID=237069 RepID=A0A1G9XVE3_9BACI|nr:DUF503 domain-containing protein [Tenuibacillus multivorans]GEL75834.1 hypothetical protein TMU01_00690 [Tenuibacillus multivorans]SDN00802.1 hypothetical protein SAMN05216498_1127 [Tenuibacillus multivorans]